MAHYDHVILGGGMSGCLIALSLAAWRKGETVAVIEPSHLGGSYAKGGFQYLRNSVGVRALLHAHKMDFTLKAMSGGVLTHKGRVLPYPQGLGGHLEAVQRLHYGKTRGTYEGYGPGVMNFGGTGGERVLTDFSRLFGLVERHCDIIQAHATVISGPMACVGPRRWIESASGRITSTVPLPILAKLLQLEGREAPVCPHEWLKVARISLTGRTAHLGHYDYTYTPWLEAIHRVRPVVDDDGNIALELEWNDRSTHSLAVDLARLGSTLLAPPRQLPGHLHPVTWRTWRAGSGSNIRLAGRFAQWNSRITVDQVVDACHEELTA